MNNVSIREESFLMTLFSELRRKDVPYVVLRNHMGFPQIPVDTDIDILISPKDEGRYKEAFKFVAQKHNVAIVRERRNVHVLAFFVYQKQPERMALWIDAFTSFTSKGLKWADAGVALKARQENEQGIYVMQKGMEGASLLLKEILANRPVKEKYFDSIMRYANQDSDSFLELLLLHINPALAKTIHGYACKGEWKDALKKGGKWRRSIFFTNLLRGPVKTVAYFMSFVIQSVLEKIKPQGGLIIACIGPDGAGKSTLCKALKNRLKDYPFRKIKMYHGTFGLFPELQQLRSAILFRRTQKDSLLAVYNLPSQNSGLRSFIHLLYYGIEGIVAWPLVFWGNMRGDVFLFDRYFYDFAIPGKNKLLFKILYNIIPRPHAVFLLVSSPEEIYRRKPEIPVEEIQKQFLAFQSEQFRRIAHPQEVRIEKDPKEIAADIEEKIVSILLRKNI